MERGRNSVHDNVIVHLGSRGKERGRHGQENGWFWDEAGKSTTFPAVPAADKAA